LNLFEKEFFSFFQQGTKIVGKHSLSIIPVLGWSWFFTESIFLRRVWETDKKILEHDIQQLVNNYPDNYYFNVL
jgi:lysophosphatidic acid acyltransferase/lysophosphatidylinositol acyltransferase